MNNVKRALCCAGTARPLQRLGGNRGVSAGFTNPRSHAPPIRQPAACRRFYSDQVSPSALNASKPRLLLDGAVLMTLATLSYQMWRDKDSQKSVEWYSQRIQDQFNRPIPLPKGVFESLIERPFMEALKRELELKDLFQLVVGPSDSGKTWSYKLAAQQRQNTFYLSLRGSKHGNFVSLLAQGLGIFDSSHLDANSLVSAFHHAVIAAGSKPGAPQPLAIIDDPQSCFLEDGSLSPEVERFLAELVNLSKEGKLAVLFLSSSRDGVKLLKQLSGYRDRLSVINMEYIPEEKVRDHLVNKENFSEEAANDIVEKLGSHLGHINKLRSKIAQIKNHAGRWTKADVEGPINDVIYDLEQHLRPLFEQEDDSLVLVMAYLVCKMLQHHPTITKTQVLSLVHQSATAEDILTQQWDLDEKIERSENIGKQFKAIEKLLEKRVLRDVDGEKVALHEQGLAAAFNNLMKKPHIQLRVQEAQKNVRNRKEQSQ